MKKVCFVCLGNICRSPMAEFVMKDLLDEQPVLVESRATSFWEHGNPIHRGSQAVFRRHNIPYNYKKSSQQLVLADFDYFDYIIGMDESNVDDLLALSAGHFDDKIKLFIEGGVPDPWYTGDFEETYRLVTAGCQQWLDRILKDA
ncbi:low molecular weight protein-tyrosine-phosphatase [Streptococcus dentiloxodontae]